jgi:hypothetical protein
LGKREVKAPTTGPRNAESKLKTRRRCGRSGRARQSSRMWGNSRCAVSIQQIRPPTVASPSKGQILQPLLLQVLASRTTRSNTQNSKPSIRLRGTPRAMANNRLSTTRAAMDLMETRTAIISNSSPLPSTLERRRTTSIRTMLFRVRSPIQKSRRRKTRPAWGASRGIGRIRTRATRGS